MTEVANPEAPFVEIAYGRPEPGVARILMNRPHRANAQRANAQGVAMTYELDRVFQRACRDPEVHVVIPAGAGNHFNEKLSRRG